MGRFMTLFALVPALATGCAMFDDMPKGDQAIPGQDKPFPVLSDMAPAQPALAAEAARAAQAKELDEERRDMGARAEALKRRLERERAPLGRQSQ